MAEVTRHCPNCNSLDINYVGGYIEHESDTVHYIFEGVCEKCKQKFNEVYSLEYVTTVKVKEN